jgi:hypothetical protein
LLAVYSFVHSLLPSYFLDLRSSIEHRTLLKLCAFIVVWFVYYSFLLVLETFCFLNFLVFVSDTLRDLLGGALLVSNNISQCFILLFFFSFHSRLFFLFLPLNVAPFPSFERCTFSSVVLQTCRGTSCVLSVFPSLKFPPLQYCGGYLLSSNCSIENPLQ